MLMMTKGKCCVRLTDAVFACLYSILLLIPDVLWIHAPGPFAFFCCCIFNLFFFLFVFTSLCFLLHRLHHVIYVVSHSLLHVVLYVFSISNVFLYVFFTLRWDAFTFQLIHQTNRQETSEFLSTYVLSYEFVAIIAFYAVLGFTEYYLVRRKGRKEVCLPLFIPVSAICFCLIHIPFFTLNHNRNYELSYSFLRRNMIWKLHQSILQYADEKDDLVLCSKNQHNIVVQGCTYQSPKIVVVIGESFNKHHSSLYGYPKDTNPLLGHWLQKRNLYVFKDVVSPYNATYSSFQAFLSFASTDDTIRWCNTPLFPSLFKKAGYHVTFYSNQFVLESEMSHSDGRAGFLFHPMIEPCFLDVRNHRKYQYDGEMIDQYKHERLQNEKTTKGNLVIFHLYGQHFSSKERYPHSFSYFDAKDYDDRSDLTMNQRQEVAEYDNATRYNDYVIHSIIDMYKDEDVILLYFSDHGDECNDFRPHVGRSFDWKSAGAQVLRHQFDIPFLLYVTDSYKQHHPQIVDEISKAVGRRFMIDDLPHLLVYLAGIETNWYRPQRNIIHSDYNLSRKRYVSFDKVDYDAYCKTVNN